MHFLHSRSLSGWCHNRSGAEEAGLSLPEQLCRGQLRGGPSHRQHSTEGLPGPQPSRQGTGSQEHVLTQVHYYTHVRVCAL